MPATRSRKTAGIEGYDNMHNILVFYYVFVRFL